MADAEKRKECFIIMPIADADGYPQGHFKHVYNNIVAPSCEKAGYQAIRADDVKATNLIHLDILKKLIEAPIAICDLSSRNPNVLFELGIRQAFDKPVVLIQESGTPRIFDIAPLRYLEYSREMKYHDVLRSQEELKDAISATVAADSDAGNVNSIVKLLALNQSAKIPELKGGKESFAFGVLQAEMREIRKLVETSIFERSRGSHWKVSNATGSERTSTSRGVINAIEFERISNTLEKLQSAKRVPGAERIEQLHMLMRETESLMSRCETQAEFMNLNNLMEQIQRTAKNLA